MTQVALNRGDSVLRQVTLITRDICDVGDTVVVNVTCYVGDSVVSHMTHDKYVTLT